MPIRHFNTGAKRRELRGVLKLFMRELEKKLESNIKSMRDWHEVRNGVSDEKLLDLRRELVGAVRQGMLERKDKEIEIAMLACFVWWNRLEKEKRFALEMQE